MKPITPYILDVNNPSKADPFEKTDGHVVAVRITAENASDGWKPTVGQIHEIEFQSLPGVWYARCVCPTLGWPDSSATLPSSALGCKVAVLISSEAVLTRLAFAPVCSHSLAMRVRAPRVAQGLLLCADPQRGGPRVRRLPIWPRLRARADAQAGGVPPPACAQAAACRR